MRHRLSIIIATLLTAQLLFSCFATTSLAQKAWEEMVPMRDGVRLATNVYLPDGEGPWPVILARTPYAKDRRIRDQIPRPKKIVPAITGRSSTSNRATRRSLRIRVGAIAAKANSRSS